MSAYSFQITSIIFGHKFADLIYTDIFYKCFEAKLPYFSNSFTLHEEEYQHSMCINFIDILSTLLLFKAIRSHSFVCCFVWM